MTITVFTPAYNRGYIIENLYRSLQRQTYRDFEWIVIDDGSTDNTEELFTTWTAEENFFPITYRKVENGGKHRAINKGTQMAAGELFFIVDSDDYLTDSALQRIVEVESTIPADEKSRFGGVCGIKAYSLDQIVGSTFEGEYLDITTLDRPKYGISGDKAEAFYTELLKKYPFPEYEGENFVTECVVWDKIANDGYKLRFFNDVVYICDYLPDGLTASGIELFIRNPRGWAIYITQSCAYKHYSLKEKWASYYNYCSAMRNRLSISQAGRYLGYRPLVFVPAMLAIHCYFHVRRKHK